MATSTVPLHQYSWLRPKYLLFALLFADIVLQWQELSRSGPVPVRVPTPSR